MRKDIKVGIGIAGFFAFGALAVVAGNMQESQKADASAATVVNVADHAFMNRCTSALGSKELKVKSRRDHSDICACVTPKIAAKILPGEVEASADLLEAVFMKSRLRVAPQSDEQVKTAIVAVKDRYSMSNLRLNAIMGDLNTSLKACAVEERVKIDKPKPVQQPQVIVNRSKPAGKSNSFESQRADERAAEEEANIGRDEAYRERRN